MSGTIHLLHHKSWHVWNKDNIAKVEKDEKEAAIKAAELKERAIQAEREARFDRLHKKRKREDEPQDFHPSQTEAPLETATRPEEPEFPAASMNFFADIEQQEREDKRRGKPKPQPHPEAEKEKKEQADRFEQQWTSYIGKDSIEQMKIKPWWYSEGPAAPMTQRRATFEQKSKVRNDPLAAMNVYLDQTANPISLKDLEDKSYIQKRNKRLKTEGEANLNRDPAVYQEKGVKIEKDKEKKDKKHKDKKHKKDKRDKKDKDKKKKKEKQRREKEEEERERKAVELEQLRKERLQREQAEANKEKQLFEPKLPPQQQNDRKRDTGGMRSDRMRGNREYSDRGDFKRQRRDDYPHSLQMERGGALFRDNY